MFYILYGQHTVIILNVFGIASSGKNWIRLSCLSEYKSFFPPCIGFFPLLLLLLFSQPCCTVDALEFCLTSSLVFHVNFYVSLYYYLNAIKCFKSVNTKHMIYWAHTEQYNFCKTYLILLETPTKTNTFTISMQDYSNSFVPLEVRLRKFLRVKLLR